MNHTFTIAQPCFFRYHTDEVEPSIRPNLQKDFILFDELSGIYEDVALTERLKRSIGIFTEVWKATYDVETWKDYGYFLVAYEVTLRDVFAAIKKRNIWPNKIMAFCDNPPIDSENLVTYDDNYVIVGLNAPKNVKLYKRRDR